jgi:biopolymer transport protein ExbD
MRFRGASRDEPEINLIPFIDVLLVVLIFLMLSTTYSKFTELQIKLPVADADAQRDYPREVIVSVSSDSVIIINADASATHQSVIAVMEAARRSGLSQITFATQSAAQAGAR